ncbi:MAG: dTMP kinase [Clostridiales bacterium]|jgi:dTMP kinase|nr:dTMP kinase [Clostridiales bacterium]
MRRGLFLSIEGPDGAGKTTQLGYIKQFFEERNIELVMTREPGGTPIGESLREILLDKNNSEMSAITEMLIYAASRAQHVAQLIRPAINRGAVVICDRYMDSSIAYQGYGRGLGDMVEEVNLHAIDGLQPDLTIFLDLDPAVGKERILSDRNECDRLEQEKLDFHYRVYEGYKAVAKSYPKRVYSIDASRTIEEVRQDIHTKLEEICLERGI